MSASPEILQAVAERMSRECPQAVALGMTTIALEPDVAVLTVPYGPDLIGDPDTGVIAGGVVTTLLDHACGQSVMAALGAPQGIATLDLRIDYMRAAEPGLDIFARAHCYRITHSIAFVRATAYDRDLEDPVATAQAAFMLTGLPPVYAQKAGDPA
ncbi:PaaI family thioesterase [Phenylobacterium montanum]|uniref:PaaI family thioesterase n=1 Tax=Phenylobacterium montanum TaxID=2823693 RepID=A0A975G3M6_9CAUL|nr:PaaI family thioesterase [Caulobacter sp. S6]QUD89963.1 PaaI family thioesterase [Caulobacter sp. S6]